MTIVRKSGFTLIELSLVVVIIGLILGGILTGRTLIEAAELRASAAQFQKYKVAVVAFREKYQFIPGDVPSHTAQQLGLYCLGPSAPADCDGDADPVWYLGNGDGMVNGFIPSVGGGETYLFWRHLSDANLIEGAYGMGSVISPTTGSPTTIFTEAGSINTVLPFAKMPVNFWLAGSSSTNYFVLSGVSTIRVPGRNAYRAALTPIQAYNIDSKLDDGRPKVGSVQAPPLLTPFRANAPNWSSADPATAAAGDCTAGGVDGMDVASVYATANEDSSTALGCSLQFLMGL